MSGKLTDYPEGLPPDPDCPRCDGVGLIAYGNGHWEVCACTGLMEAHRRNVLIDSYTWIVANPTGLHTETEKRRHKADAARLRALLTDTQQGAET